MGAKFKFKTHTSYVFYFIFCAVFCTFGLKIKKKYKYDLKILFEKNQIRYQKTHKFMLILNSLKKFWKNALKKL